MARGERPLRSFEYNYATRKAENDLTPNIKSNGYSVIGEVFNRQFNSAVKNTKYYRETISARDSYIAGYIKELDEAFEHVSLGASDTSGALSDLKDALDGLKSGGEDLAGSSAEAFDKIYKAFEQMLKKMERAARTGKYEKEKSDKKKETAVTDKIQEFEEEFSNRTQGFSKAEGAVALVLDQIYQVTKQIYDKAMAGRDEAVNIYNQNLSAVASRGVFSKGDMKMMPNSVDDMLKGTGLTAGQLSLNEITKSIYDLVNKGYSAQDSSRMAIQDAVTKKIAPYLDTQSTAFKDLQLKFGDNFLTEIRGINNYVQNIAGSAKVFEANINNIITSLEPIQLWAETQMWGEEELAALDYLVEKGGMTQSQAAQLIQSALKVATDQSGAITGGTTLEKVAVATGQTDFGSALQSILSTATIAGNSNQLAQGVALDVLGASGFISENSNIPKMNNWFSEGMGIAGTSKSASEYGEEQYESFISGEFTSTQERLDNISANAGSQFAYIKETFPLMVGQFEKMVNLETLSNTILGFIAVENARNLFYSGTGTGTVAQGALGSLKSLFTGGTAAAGGVAGAVGSILPTVLGIAAALGITAFSAYKIGQSYTKTETEKFALPSYDIGTDYVPEDQIALVHKGEAVLTAEENREYKNTSYNKQVEMNDKLIATVKECTIQMIKAFEKYSNPVTYQYDSDTEGLKNSQSVSS